VIYAAWITYDKVIKKGLEEELQEKEAIKNYPQGLPPFDLSNAPRIRNDRLVMKRATLK
jgi:hypothetical protein